MSTNDGMQGAREAIKYDALVLAWSSVSLIATFGLCVLIGVKAVGIAAVLILLAAWNLNWSKRRLPRRFWQWCWASLLVLDLVLAFLGTRHSL